MCIKEIELPDTSFLIFIFPAAAPVESTYSTRFDDWDIGWNKWVKKYDAEIKPANTVKKEYLFHIAILSVGTAVILMPVL